MSLGKEFLMRRRVLITDAERSDARAIIAALERLPQVDVHAASSDPSAIGLSLVPLRRRHVLPSPASPTHIVQLLWRCTGELIEVVVPMSPATRSRIATARGAFRRAGVGVAVLEAVHVARWVTPVLPPGRIIEAHTS